MNFWLAIFLITTTTSQVYKIKLHGSATDQFVPTISFDLTLGNPPQTITVFLHSSFKDVIVVDSECGRPRKDCPKYCGNIEFSKYCNILCHITEQSYPLICWKEWLRDPYTADNSSTYKLIKNKEWNHQLTTTRPLYGKYATDGLEIKTFDNKSSLMTDDFEFVRGLSLDSRLVLAFVGITSGSIFGISPDNETSILRLYNKRIIKAPILSVSLHDYHLTIGAEDNEKCKNWYSYKVADPNSWTFEVESIKMSDIGEFKNVRVLSMPEWPFIQLPRSVTDQLLREKIIAYNAQDFFFVVDCAFKMTIEFKFQHQTLYFNQDDVIVTLDSEYYNSTTCYAMMSTSEITPYEIYPEWRLGTSFFRKYCHSFNFEQKTIGFGEQK